MTILNDSLTSFTQRMPSAYAGNQDWNWYLHDIVRWRKFYMTHLLARTAVDRIPDDCFRKGYTYGGADPAQLNLLLETERRLKVREIKKKALTFSRLDGEAYIYMDNGQDSAEYLDPETVGRDGLRFITMLRVDDIVKGPPDLDPMSQFYMQPQWYQVVSNSGTQVMIHPSRMCKFIRNPDPNTGIGISDLALFHDAIEQLEEAECNVSALTKEARIDVMKVKDLMAIVSDPTEEALLTKRYQLVADLKKTNNMIIMDAAGEDYQQKQTNFSNLDTIIETYRRGYCAMVEIPYALVYGRQGGLGTNGETDLITYYENISTIQRNDISDSCYALNECIIRSALGNRPPEIFIDWHPLHETTEKERVENAVKVADAVDKLIKAQVMPADVLTEPTVNWLTEMGAFQGLEQSYNDWKDGGGTMDEIIEPEADDRLVAKETEEVKIEDAEKKSLWDKLWGKG